MISDTISHSRTHAGMNRSAGRSSAIKSYLKRSKKKVHEDALAVLKSMGIKIKNDEDVSHEKEEK